LITTIASLPGDSDTKTDHPKHRATEQLSKKQNKFGLKPEKSFVILILPAVNVTV
jgi:hypothetical protein